jgi:hypothetical protein
MEHLKPEELVLLRVVAEVGAISEEEEELKVEEVVDLAGRLD